MNYGNLEDIAELIAGQSPPSKTYNKSGIGLPFFQGKADYGKRNPVIKTWCSEPTKIAFPGDILISVRAPVGPVNINNVESCIGRGLSAIRVKENISRDYVYFFLKTNEERIANMGVGSTFSAITQKDLRRIKIPLPEFDEQVSIAKLLSKAESLIAQRKESIRLLDEFLKSTFLEMFGDPVKNSKSWKIDKINAFSNCIVPGRNKPKSFTGNIPWITTEDLKHKGFIKNSRDNLGLNVTEIIKVRAKIVPPGSVLMTCVGDLGIVSINTVDCVVNQQLHTFQPKEELNSIFLMYVLDFQTKSMYKMSNSTTVPYLNKSKCNSIPIILPPLYIQTRFAKIVKETEIIKKQYGRSLIELENLYSSLSQKAFKGEIGKM